MQFITNLWNSFASALPDILVAVLYLLLAFLVAIVSKKIVMGVLEKTGAEKALTKTGVKDEKTGKSTEFIGKLVFLIVFLLFLPAVLTRLGMDNVAMPITSVVSDVIGYLPKLLAAGIILTIGIYVARVIRQLIKALLDRVGLNKLQEKLGVETEEEQNTFAGVIAGVVYVLILIPIIIAVLEVLGLQAVSIPATTLLNRIFDYLPNLFVALILLIVGNQLAKLLAPVIESLLISVGADKLSEKVFPITEMRTTKISIAKIVGQIVRWLILVVFFIEAVNLLKLDILTTIGAAVLRYLPFVVSAILIMGGGLLLASWVERLITKHSSKNRPVALVVKIVIITLAAVMTLSQLGFAQSIVNLAFVITLAGAALAFALAFGIGGRSFAENRLAQLECKLDGSAECECECGCEPCEGEACECEPCECEGQEADKAEEPAQSEQTE